MPRSTVSPARAQKPSSASTKNSNAPQRLKNGDEIRLRKTRRGVPPNRPKSSTGNSPQTVASSSIAKSKKSPKVKPSKSKTPKLRHKLANSVKKSVARRRLKKITRADLINAESRLGSKIFGPIPEGHRREFFHDQQNIWIWHESWLDESRHPRQMTVRYEVRPSGVYKKLSAGRYVKLEGDELENFRHATHAYLRTIKQNLYHRA